MWQNLSSWLTGGSVARDRQLLLRFIVLQRTRRGEVPGRQGAVWGRGPAPGSRDTSASPCRRRRGTAAPPPGSLGRTQFGAALPQRGLPLGSLSRLQPLLARNVRDSPGRRVASGCQGAGWSARARARGRPRRRRGSPAARTARRRRRGRGRRGRRRRKGTRPRGGAGAWSSRRGGRRWRRARGRARRRARASRCRSGSTSLAARSPWASRRRATPRRRSSRSVSAPLARGWVASRVTRVSLRLPRTPSTFPSRIRRWGASSAGLAWRHGGC